MCSNSRYLNRDRLETLVLEMVSEVVLEKGHLEQYYQKCLEEYNRNQGEREEELKRLRQQLQEKDDPEKLKAVREKQKEYMREYRKL